MADTTTTQLATAIPAEWINKVAIEEARPFNVVAPLCMRYELGQGEGLVFKPQKLPTTTAAAVAEGSDIIAATRTMAEGTITASEVGLATRITDKAAKAARVGGDLLTWAASQGRAMGQKLTGDFCALFAALNSSSAVGTTATNMTLADFVEAKYTLDNANAPGLRSCVLHPRQVADLWNALSGAGAIFQNLSELIRNGRLPEGTPSAGFEGLLFGVPIYSTTEVDTANSAADVCGVMMVKEALGAAWQKGLVTEYDRDPSFRVSEVVISACYGVGEICDTFGVAIETDA